MTPKDASLLLPGADRWELWPASSPNGSVAVRAIESPAAAPADRVVCVGLPARFVHALPLWVVKAEGAAPSQMIEAQLERRSLTGPSGPVPHHAREIAEESGRALHLTAALSPALPEELCLARAQRFEPTPALYPLPADRLTLWVEEGRYVAAVTRGTELAYFQALGSNTLDDTLAGELRCLLLGLFGEGIVPSCKGITLWEPVPETARLALEEALRLPVETAPRPRPRLPEPPCQLVPPRVVAAREQERRRRRTRRWIALVGLVYLLLALAVAGSAALKYREILSLRTSLATDAEAIQRLQETAARWRALAPALEPDHYPIERLFQAASLLPPEGVRLILFEQRGPAIQMTGEARNAPAAFDFLEKLKKAPAWQAYQWQMPAPRLLPNGSAQFQIEGKRSTPGDLAPNENADTI